VEAAKVRAAVCQLGSGEVAVDGTDIEQEATVQDCAGEVAAGELGTGHHADGECAADEGAVRQHHVLEVDMIEVDSVVRAPRTQFDQVSVNVSDDATCGGPNRPLKVVLQFDLLVRVKRPHEATRITSVLENFFDTRRTRLTFAICSLLGRGEM
jgi:hypothetical protein